MDRETFLTGMKNIDLCHPYAKKFRNTYLSYIEMKLGVKFISYIKRGFKLILASFKHFVNKLTDSIIVKKDDVYL